VQNNCGSIIAGARCGSFPELINVAVSIDIDSTRDKDKLVLIVIHALGTEITQYLPDLTQVDEPTIRKWVLEEAVNATKRVRDCLRKVTRKAESLAQKLTRGRVSCSKKRLAWTRH